MLRSYILNSLYSEFTADNNINSPLNLEAFNSIDLESIIRLNDELIEDKDKDKEKGNSDFYLNSLEGNNKSFKNKNPIFIVTKNTNIFTCQKLNKKRGRKLKGSKRIKGKIKDIEYEIKIHDKNISDNLLRKIQVHYMNFIISYLNDLLKNILENSNYFQNFLNLENKFKINTKKSFVQSLKSKTIGDIINRDKISSKYKNKVSNKEKYKILKKNKIIKNIFEENYLNLFKNVYYKNKRTINLKKYGLDKEIILSDKVKMFDELLSRNNKLDKIYEENIKKCVIKNYII